MTRGHAAAPSARGFVAALAWACAPVVVLATLFATGSGGARADELSMGSDAGGLSRTLPDPPPLRERAQYVVDLRWVRGDVYLVSMTRATLPEPRESPRAMGRFALELYEGGTLVERVRFDFPLLGADEAPGRTKLSSKLSTRIGVTFPATSRGTHLELWDRATDTRWSIPWPAATLGRALLPDGGPAVAEVGGDAGRPRTSK